MIDNPIPGELYYISDRASLPVMYLEPDPENLFYVKVLAGDVVLSTFRAFLLERTDVEK